MWVAMPKAAWRVWGPAVLDLGTDGVLTTREFDLRSYLRNEIRRFSGPAFVRIPLVAGGR